ncbi:LOB domain-containing protein 4-like [Humulus lupulus]|uniref:LOB domain-containing protein 4-like n=1 Tax=Humulus lupulus TaxID=3486 RepID=UPI002B405AF3|nr:LOB domain-containing protein 4-like [Humulus lupulus]
MASSGSDEDGEGFLPCACCKHQRKKCSPNCQMAPYFPATKYQEYLNAQKIFGTTNIVRIVNSVEPHNRVAAADTLMAEALARRNDPVRGCYGIIRHLKLQVALHEAQLLHVNRQLAFFKAQEEKHVQKQMDLEKLQLFASLSSPANDGAGTSAAMNNIARPSHSNTGSSSTANPADLTPTSTHKQIIDLESLEFEDETADLETSQEAPDLNALAYETIDLLRNAFSQDGNNTPVQLWLSPDPGWIEAR